MAYDCDRLLAQGGKAQRLNFPLLRQHYKQILADLADLHTPDGLLDFLAVAVQAAVKAARTVPGATAPENTGPAAASVLNPRRPIPLPSTAALPVAASAAPPARSPLQQAAAPVAAAAAAASEAESDDLEEPPEPAPVEQAEAARARAKQLAASCSLAAGLALCSTAHVRLEAASGLAWRNTSLSCLVDATVGQLAKAVAAGLEQQYGLPAGAAAVGLSVASDLDATADFDALCYEDADSGMLLLRGHVEVRRLWSLLDDRHADLRLEYHTVLPKDVHA
ncbi:hypothetical protein C2E21_8830 [Chlorella sorokiniana]|uniref:Uncharacterized protein n=1 Tax=Chlorella sorokiniana TaxID=3076 RepID=A0A2P6TDE8_CHLSO|nr:hypothetical protein C2E21_8830 [Chlorella sorokiniana]|eukprot:PRW20670.1 hypothetical protein C2E21_8830 [Chlorella sorokiniana]